MLDQSSQLNYFNCVTDADTVGAQDFQPEDFHCCMGTILIVLPPKITKTPGGLDLPQTSYIYPDIGRVASVPPDPGCPVKPGDWIITRHLDSEPVKFSGRDDLRLVQYADDASSEILGFFKAVDYEAANEEARKRFKDLDQVALDADPWADEPAGSKTILTDAV